VHSNFVLALATTALRYIEVTRPGHPVPPHPPPVSNSVGSTTGKSSSSTLLQYIPFAKEQLRAARHPATASSFTDCCAADFVQCLALYLAADGHVWKRDNFELATLKERRVSTGRHALEIESTQTATPRAFIDDVTGELQGTSQKEPTLFENSAFDNHSISKLPLQQDLNQHQISNILAYSTNCISPLQYFYFSSAGRDA
jgi:hypothetical protein